MKISDLSGHFSGRPVCMYLGVFTLVGSIREIKRIDSSVEITLSFAVNVPGLSDCQEVLKQTPFFFPTKPLFFQASRDIMVCRSGFCLGQDMGNQYDGPGVTIMSLAREGLDNELKSFKSQHE